MEPEKGILDIAKEKAIKKQEEQRKAKEEVQRKNKELGRIKGIFGRLSVEILKKFDSYNDFNKKKNVLENLLKEKNIINIFTENPDMADEDYTLLLREHITEALVERILLKIEGGTKGKEAGEEFEAESIEHLTLLGIQNVQIGKKGKKDLEWRSFAADFEDVEFVCQKKGWSISDFMSSYVENIIYKYDGKEVSFKSKTSTPVDSYSDTSKILGVSGGAAKFNTDSKSLEKESLNRIKQLIEVAKYCNYKAYALFDAKDLSAEHEINVKVQLKEALLEGSLTIVWLKKNW